MARGTGGSRESGRRRTDTPAISAGAAAVLLVVSVAVVGAVGYAVLSMVASESSSTATSGGCTPAASPECAGHGPTTSSTSNELVAYHLAR
jgi:hypothetical protein